MKDTVKNSPKKTPNEEIFKELTTEKPYAIGDKQTEEGKKETLKEKAKRLFHTYKKDPRAWVIAGLTILIPIVTGILVVVFGYDSYIFPSSIAGRVIIEDSNINVSGAKVYIEKRFFVRNGEIEEFVTDDDGLFTVHNLHNGLVTLKVEIDGFETFTGEVQLERGQNEVNIHLTQVDFAQLQLQLVAEEGYDFSKSVFSIRGVEYALTDNGFLFTDNLPIGKIEIAFSSPDYVDFRQALELAPGMNMFDDIVLTPGGDIVLNVRNWVTQAPLGGKDVTIADNTQKTNQSGKIAVRDLPVGEEVSITSHSSGYLVKEIPLTVEQGINNETFDLVPAGKVVYLSNRGGSRNVYAANYDGTNEQLLTPNEYDATHAQMSREGNSVYFFSQIDNLSEDLNGYPITLPYSVNISGANIQKMYTSPTIPHRTMFFPRSGLMSSYTNFILSYGPISGNNQQNIVDTQDDGFINGVKISDDGTTLYYFVTTHNNPADDGMYRYDLSSGESSLVAPGSTGPFDVTFDGTKVLYSKLDQGIGQNLYVYDHTTQTETQLTSGSSVHRYSQFTLDGASVIFISDRDAKTNIYLTPSGGGAEIQLTDTNNVIGIQLMDSHEYIFYYTDEALFVTSLSGTGDPQQVSNNVLPPLGSVFAGNF